MNTNLDGADPSEPVQFEIAAQPVSGLWTEATRPVALAAIAHGAGAGMRHPFMAGVVQGLVEGGVSALRFNFPYMDARRRVPDPAPLLLATWEAALQQVADRGSGLPLIAGGKSMGGRIASMLAAARGPDFPGAALVFFGYPLHAPGKTDHPRDAHLPRIHRPMLFIQGTRDALARFDLIEALATRLYPLARLQAIEGADHSFRVRGTKRSDRDIGGALGRIAAAYVHDIVNPSGAPAA